MTTSSVFEKNISAIKHSQPKIAEQIHNIPLPEDIEFTNALDGTMTAYSKVLSNSGWFTGSSAPYIREKTLLDKFKDDGSNILLIGSGQGIGIKLLLERISPHQSIIIWEKNPLLIKILLHLYDFSEDIRRYRLLFILLPSLREGLIDLFWRFNYIAFPTKMLHWPWFSEQEIKRLTTDVDAAYDAVAEKIKNLIQSAEQKFLAMDPNEKNITIITPTAELIYHKWAKMIANNLKGDFEISLYLLDQPEHSTFIKLIDSFTQTLPKTIISLSTGRSNLPMKLPNSVRFISIFSLNNMKLMQPTLDKINLLPDEVCIVGNKENEKKLKEKFPNNIVELVEVSIDSITFVPQDDERKLDVAVFAHNISDTPEDYGIKHQSHKKLWDKANELIGKAPLSLSSDNIEELLRKAERTSGVRLSEKKLFDSFANLIKQYLLPAKTTNLIIKELKKAELNIQIYGKNFDETPLYDIDTLNKILDTSKLILIVNTDVITYQILLDSIAKKRPIMVKNIIDLPNEKYFIQELPCLEDIKTVIEALESPQSYQELCNKISRLRSKLISQYSLKSFLASIITD